MVGDGGDDAIFERVSRGEAEDANGFDADVLVGGGVDDGGVGLIGDGAGENVGGTAGCMGEMEERNLDLLERAVVVEAEVRELSRAEFIVDMHAGMDFFAAVATDFKADAGFEQFDLGRGGGFGRPPCLKRGALRV
jgi:hypothetical protein